MSKAPGAVEHARDVGAVGPARGFAPQRLFLTPRQIFLTPQIFSNSSSLESEPSVSSAARPAARAAARPAARGGIAMNANEGVTGIAMNALQGLRGQRGRDSRDPGRSPPREAAVAVDWACWACGRGLLGLWPSDGWACGRREQCGWQSKLAARACGRRGPVAVDCWACVRRGQLLERKWLH